MTLILYNLGYISQFDCGLKLSWVNIFISVDIESTNKTPVKNRPASQAGDFVTVIEVNGLKAAEKAAKKSDESPQSSESSSTEASATNKKKVPPK